MLSIYFYFIFILSASFNFYERYIYLLQFFAVLFFVMMFVLGVGSIVGMVSGVVTCLKEKLPNMEIWKIVLSVCSMGFAVSTVYVTPARNLQILKLLPSACFVLLALR